MADMRTFNVVVLGFSFMFIFTAFQTGGMIEQTVIQSVLKEGNFQGGSGYVSLAIIYSVFALANWGAPSVVSVFGPRCSMVIGAVMYCLFIAVFIYPMVWALYLGSVLIGLGAAVIWTAQGSFLTTNSTQETIGRNSGIFWALLQCSLLFGNIFVWQEFSGKETIDSKTRIQVYVVLLVVCCVGTLMLFVLRNRRPEDRSDLLNVNRFMSFHANFFCCLLERSIQLLKTKEMLLLGVCFAYTGFELTFFSGVYGTCIGNTRAFDLQQSSIHFSINSFISSFTYSHINPFICFIDLFIFSNTTGIFITVSDITELGTFSLHSKYVAILCSFLLGLGDSSFNTQVYSILGFMFPEDSAPAFALFKFVQSLTAAAGFFYSKYLLLQWQLLILVVFGVAGTLAFFEVEWKTASASRKGYTQIG
uniref:UNC93-like protein MFSD11 n=1 Tax=Branchiostoma floridae TaxID=7739 RepID=C3Y8U9_BRAFL|eukprot:XP_002606995.1 hypothetical protein BRAFLDRAFT_260130 [Branchiostoma floridae]